MDSTASRTATRHSDYHVHAMSHIHSTDPATTQALLDDAAQRCRQRGTSLTPIRRTVLGLLLDEPGGLKAYDLLDRIKQVRASATPPTIYRALDFLIEQGLAHRIARTNQFIACNHEGHDVACLFLVCPQCGQVTELHDDAALAGLMKGLKAAGHALASPEIELSAVCAECSRSGA